MRISISRRPITVSYTHLDVYKRQTVLILCLSVPYRASGIRDNPAKHEGIILQYFVVYSVPVSDTHLDVYKRQVLWRVVILLIVKSVHASEIRYAALG